MCGCFLWRAKASGSLDFVGNAPCVSAARDPEHVPRINEGDSGFPGLIMPPPGHTVHSEVSKIMDGLVY